MNFIRQLWRGDVTLIELVHPTSDEYNDTLEIMESEEAYWKKKLSKEDHERLEQLLNAYSKNEDLFSEEAFITALKLASLFFVELYNQTAESTTA